MRFSLVVTLTTARQGLAGHQVEGAPYQGVEEAERKGGNFAESLRVRLCGGRSAASIKRPYNVSSTLQPHHEAYGCCPQLFLYPVGSLSSHL